MKNRTQLLLMVVLFASVASPGQGIHTIRVYPVFVSRSLSGHVKVGPGVGNGITVELCSSEWKTVLASTKTDNTGYFSFQKPPGKLFYLRFWSYGLDPLEIHVKVKKLAIHDLTIGMENST